MFDTGGEGRRLLSHMQILGKDPGQIDMVFLSHNHGDHTGGLRELTARNPQLEVYVPKSFPAGFDDAAAARGWRVIRTSSPMEISPGVFSTGEMGAWTREQSLILQGEKGTIVLTGCAHPGIVKVIKRARSLISGGIRLAIGGYHLFSANQWEIIEVIRAFKENDVKRVCPCHCTGDLAKNLLRKSYGGEYIEGGVGRVIGVH
jgi:7,8-dihydropterin-6-yl-methyl-4-(beta-D-ribofuranosyl)aminobenzene 5'-phosphate synthase